MRWPPCWRRMSHDRLSASRPPGRADGAHERGGHRYVSGFLRKARVIDFWGGGADRDGNAAAVLHPFVQEPDQRPQERQAGRPSASAPAPRQERAERAGTSAGHCDGDVPANLNDPIPF